MALPWLHGLEMVVEETKPCIDLSTCDDTSQSPWLKHEVVVENPDLVWTLPCALDLPCSHGFGWRWWRNSDIVWAPPPAMDLPRFHGLEITVEEPKPCVDLSTCSDPSSAPWLKHEVVVGNPDLAWTCPPDVDLPWLHDLEMTVEEPKPWVDPSTCHGPSLALKAWVGYGGGTQTSCGPLHLLWTFPGFMARR